MAGRPRAQGGHPGLGERSAARLAERERIGRRAAALVRPGGTAMVESGSTTLQFARFLACRGTRCMVVTNSLPVAMTPGHAGGDVILRPGDDRPDEAAAIGTAAVDVLDRHHADRCMIGASGLALGGPCEAVRGFAAIKRAMIRRSAATHLLIDGDRFGRPGVATLAGMSALAFIVVESWPEIAAALDPANVEIVTADRRGGHRPAPYGIGPHGGADDRNDNRILYGAAVAALLVLAGPAAAQDGPRGDLDDRVCERDGNLIADIPEDPDQLIDPDTLIFAHAPVEDPAVFQTAWADVLTRLEDATGEDVAVFPVQSNAAQIAAMRSGLRQIAGFNPGSNPAAVTCAGFRLVTIMATGYGGLGHEKEIVTHPGSGVAVIQDIRGGEARLCLAHVELGLQGALGQPEGRSRHGSRARRRAGLLGQARHLDPRRGQSQRSRGRRRKLRARVDAGPRGDCRGPDRDDPEVPDLPDNGRPGGPEPRARTAEPQRPLRLRVGGDEPAGGGRAERRCMVHPDHRPGAQESHPQARRGQRCQRRVPVTTSTVRRGPSWAAPPPSRRHDRGRRPARDLTGDRLTTIHGEEGWAATIRKVDDDETPTPDFEAAE